MRGAHGLATPTGRLLRATGARALGCLAAAALLAQAVLLASGVELAAFDPTHAHVSRGPARAHTHPSPREAAAAIGPHCDTGPAHQHLTPDAGVVGCAPGGMASASVTASALGAPLIAAYPSGPWVALDAHPAPTVLSRVDALEPPPPRG